MAETPDPLNQRMLPGAPIAPPRLRPGRFRLRGTRQVLDERGNMREVPFGINLHYTQTLRQGSYEDPYSIQFARNLQNAAAKRAISMEEMAQLHEYTVQELHRSLAQGTRLQISGFARAWTRKMGATIPGLDASFASHQVHTLTAPGVPLGAMGQRHLWSRKYSDPTNIFGNPLESGAMGRLAAARGNMSAAVRRNRVTGELEFIANTVAAGGFPFDSDFDLGKVGIMQMGRGGRSVRKAILDKQPHNILPPVFDVMDETGYVDANLFGKGDLRLHWSRAQFETLKSLGLAQGQLPSRDQFLDDMAGFIRDPRVGLKENALARDELGDIYRQGARRGLRGSLWDQMAAGLSMNKLRYYEKEFAGLKGVSKGLDSYPSEILNSRIPSLKPLFNSLWFKRGMGDVSVDEAFAHAMSIPEGKRGMAKALEDFGFARWLQPGRLNPFKLDRHGEISRTSIMQNGVIKDDVTPRYVLGERGVTLGKTLTSRILRDQDEQAFALIEAETLGSVRNHRRAIRPDLAGLDGPAAPIMLSGRDLSGGKQSLLGFEDSMGRGRGYALLPEWRYNPNTGEGRWLSPGQALAEYLDRVQGQNGSLLGGVLDPEGRQVREWGRPGGSWSFDRLFQKEGPGFKIRDARYAKEIVGRIGTATGLSEDEILNRVSAGGNEAFSELVLLHDLKDPRKGAHFNKIMRAVKDYAEERGEILTYRRTPQGRVELADNTARKLAQRFLVTLDDIPHGSESQWMGAVGSMFDKIGAGISGTSLHRSKGGFAKGVLLRAPGEYAPVEDGHYLGSMRRYLRNWSQVARGVEYDANVALRVTDFESLRDYMNPNRGAKNPGENMMFATRQGMEKRWRAAIVENEFLAPMTASSKEDLTSRFGLSDDMVRSYTTKAPFSDEVQTRWEVDLQHPEAQERLFNRHWKVVSDWGDKEGQIVIEDAVLQRSGKVDHVLDLDELIAKGNVPEWLRLAGKTHGIDMPEGAAATPEAMNSFFDQLKGRIEEGVEVYQDGSRRSGGMLYLGNKRLVSTGEPGDILKLGAREMDPIDHTKLAQFRGLGKMMRQMSRQMGLARNPDPYAEYSAWASSKSSSLMRTAAQLEKQKRSVVQLGAILGNPEAQSVVRNGAKGTRVAKMLGILAAGADRFMR